MAGLDAPELKADMERAATECAAFEAEYKGTLERRITGAGAGAGDGGGGVAL